MANNREIVFRADGRRNPAFLYRDTAETVKMFSLTISSNIVYRELHRAYDNFTVDPEDMKKLKEAFNNEVVNSIASHIQKVKAVLSMSKKKVAEKEEKVIEKKVEQKKETLKKEEQPEKKKEPEKETRVKPILKPKVKTTKEK